VLRVARIFLCRWSNGSIDGTAAPVFGECFPTSYPACSNFSEIH
jgi:hypothetical protein